MSQFPSLPLFTDAFLADTGHLSAQETGAYVLLLMMAWRSPECRIPDDDAKLARWARVDKRTWLRIKPTVMEFWALADGAWTQKRLSKERDFVSKRAEVARQNGLHGGRPKSLENNDSQNPAGSSRVTQQKAPNPNPSPNPTEEEKKDKNITREDRASQTDFPSNAFELWYGDYPHKVGRQAAEKSFEKIRKRGDVTFAQLVAGRDRYIANKPARLEWCNPATWLNQGRWDDAPAPEPQQGRPPDTQPRRSGQSLYADIAREAHELLTRSEAHASPFDANEPEVIPPGHGVPSARYGHLSVYERPGGEAWDRNEEGYPGRVRAFG